MRSLHVCFVSQEYPPDTGWGGIGSYTYEMAHGLARAGHRVSVISRAVNDETVTTDGDVEVHRIFPSPKWDRMRVIWRLGRYWPGFAWAAMMRLREINARSRVDIVEAGEDRADSFFIPWLRRRPKIVVRLHTAWIFVDRLNGVVPDRKKRFAYWLEKQAIVRADAVTAPSQAVVDLTGTWIPLGDRQIAVVPNPVNKLSFCPNGNVRKSEVLFVGRLEQRKILTLSQALPAVLRRCADASFRFVGSDTLDPTGCSWRERLTVGLSPSERSRLHFEQLPRQELRQRYSQAAICVLPSLWENFAYATLESMACGTPVVATRTGGFPELVDDGVTGVLVPPEEPQLLASAICQLLERPDRAAELGRNARKRVEEHFCVERVLPRMLEVYQSIASRS